VSELTRFTLEEEILDCSGILGQLDTLIKAIGDDGNLDPDFLLNYLIGVKTVYDVKFTHTQNTLETLIENGKLS